jgi:4-amino-4-deoxy-L-arabinose transferase-like glycosyltransferase
VLVTWLSRTPAGALREELKSLQFWSLESCVLFGLLLGSTLLRELLRGLERSDRRRMVMLAALSISLTVFVAPRTNRIYYDEQIYQSVGQNLTDLKLAQVCHDGNVEYGRLQCGSGEYNKQPYAYPHLLSLAYRLFGVHPATAFVVNAAVAGLTICCVYLFVFCLFRSRDAAFFGALLMALTPEQLLWSATAAVEPSASLACVAALLCAVHASRSNSLVAMAGAIVGVAYAVQFRPESFLIVPVAGLLLWPRIARELTRPRLWWLGLLFLVLVGVPIGHMFAVRNVEWGTTEARLSLGYIVGNLRVNGLFYLADSRFPLLFTLLAVIGMPGRMFRAERSSMVMYFLLFFGMYLSFYAGSYNYGADVRYSLMTYPPIAALGGLGAARLVNWLKVLPADFGARHALTAALAFQFLWYLPVVRATTEEAWAARADVHFARSFAFELPANSYVLTHNPGMFHLWRISAGQMSAIATNPAYVNFLARRYTGGVYLHWNFWCNVQDPIQVQFCRRALEMHAVEMIREYRERDQRFVLYRLKIQGN